MPPPLLPVRCPNPNCSRCQKARHVQQRAKEKLDDLVQKCPSTLSERLRDSVCNPQKFASESQDPTVLMVRDLPSQEIVTNQHTELRDYLAKIECAKLLEEIQKTPSTFWVSNETPTGSWEVLFLANQGQWNLQVWDACPTLAQLVDSMPNLLDESLFGNAMISKIQSGTTIEPHCGLSNVRHRLQITLQSPPRKWASQARLRVGPREQELDWTKHGNFFVFDDSYVHSVEYPVGQMDGCRIVVIVDLWNPCLTSTERDSIRRLYPPS
jgi:aspartyl/asparaginyl beta-hydroxylase (cupin superfamily)